MFILACAALALFAPNAPLGHGGGPPTVTSTHPAEAATGVEVKGTFTATFNVDMDPATLTSTTFSVAAAGGTPLQGTVTYDAQSRTARFAPLEVLAPETRYSATITGGARDLEGNGLSGDFVWSFATGRPAQGDKPAMSLENEGDYSYVIPALEILGFEFALNQFDRHFIDKAVYTTNWGSIRNNITHPWIFDTDPFSTNQLMHPYSGSVYFSFSRSAGLSFWESMAYTFVGSMVWELAGETGAPSINDQIMTSIGGSFLGEALFRMANLLLAGGDERPGFWRELGAAVISPPTAFNRNLLCGRFQAVYPDNDPAIFMRLRLGGSLKTEVTDNGVSKAVNRYEAVADFSLAYGLPGKPGYAYRRPFDYFHFETTLSSSPNATFENVMVRGLLLGTTYEEGSNYRGIWGLYGSYDYISPEIFRISSTALSLGTTGQLWIARDIALQGTVLGGFGFGSSGTIAPLGERDYHYGTMPQALVSLRLIFGDVAMLDATAREYYVTGLGIDGRFGHENIVRGQVSFTVRICDQHALGIQWVASERDAIYSTIPNRHQTTGTFSLVYNFLGDTHFGAVDWRNLEGR